MYYKYLPPERIDVLKNRSIRFSQPIVLNDPFEASYLVQSKETIDGLFKDIDEKTQKLWNALDESKKNDDNKKILEKEVENMKNNTQKKMSPIELGKRVADKINKDFGFLSLSKTDSSLLMWAHYASSYSGFIIGFNEEASLVSDIDSNGNVTKPRSVVYSSKRVVVDTYDTNIFEKLFLTKPIEWFYEEEVRVFREFENKKTIKKDSYGYPIFLFKFTEDSIKEIIVGHKCRILEKLKEIIKTYNTKINIYQMQIDSSSYSLIKEKVLV
jgi:hypothetical protein